MDGRLYPGGDPDVADLAFGLLNPFSSLTVQSTFCSLCEEGKVNVIFNPEEATKAQRGIGGIALLFL
jgi:hypothetical protein